MTDAQRTAVRSRVDRKQRADWFATVGSLLLRGLVAVVIIGGVIAFTVPLGGARQIDGRIVGFAIREQDKGSHPYAQIDLAKRSPVWVRLPRLSTCRIGQQVTVVETSVWFGSRYALGQRACLPIRAADDAGR